MKPWQATASENRTIWTCIGATLLLAGIMFGFALAAHGQGLGYRPTPGHTGTTVLVRTNWITSLGWDGSHQPFVTGSEIGWWPQAGGYCTTVDAGTNLSCMLTTAPVAFWAGVRYYVQGDTNDCRVYSDWSPMMHYPGWTVLHINGFGLQSTGTLNPPDWQDCAWVLSITNPTGAQYFRSLDPDGPIINQTVIYN